MISSGSFSRYFILALLLVFCASAACAEPARRVRVAAFPYYPAIFQEPDGTVKGFYVDMLDEIAAKENIQFDYVFMPWHEGLEKIQSGEVDLLNSVAFTEERAAFIDYGRVPLLTVWGELYVRENSPLSSIKDVDGKTVAVMRNDFNALHFVGLLDRFGFSYELLTLADFEQVFSAVSEGRADAGVANVVFGGAKDRQYGLKSTGVIFNPFDIFFAVAKGQNTELLAMLDRYLEEWRRNDESIYYQSRFAWSNRQDPPKNHIPGWLAKLSIFLGLAVVVSFAFIYLLRREVNRKTRLILQREARLRESNAMIHLLLNSTAEAIYGLDRNGHCTFCNQACLQMLGYADEGELLGKNIHELIHHSCADGSRIDVKDCKIFQAFRDGQKSHCDTEVLWRSDGSSFPAEYWSYPIVQDNEVLGSVVTFMDISERKKAESKLKENQDAYMSILAAAHDGFWIADLQGNFLDVNATYARQSGYSRDELLAMNISQLDALETPEVMRQHIQKVVNSGSDLFETVHRRKDGSLWDVEVSCTFSNTTQGRIFVFMRDITERKEVTQTLKEKNEELEQFVYTVSHDLRSPLVTMRSFLDLLQQDLLDNDTDEIAEDIKHMKAAGEKMEKLLSELLQLSRAGRQSGPTIEVRFRDVLDESLVSVKGALMENKITVQIDDPDIVLYGDPLRFSQIWQNLIDNAIKYSRHMDKPRIEIGMDDLGVDKVFYVRDNGIGIAVKDREKVFSLFEKLDRQSDGSGLGLALVKKIVEVYQGRIWVESHGLGMGSCFKFTLPAALNPCREG